MDSPRPALPLARALLALVGALALALGLAPYAAGAAPLPGPPARPAGTTIPAGTIGTQTWTLTNSPYIVTGSVTVAPGATLTIEPGVEVRFNGLYGLSVQGILAAVGTAGQPITFTGATKQQASWTGLVFGSSDSAAPLITGSALSHVVVEYGGYPASGNIQLYHARATIDHARISYGGGAGVYSNDGVSWADITDTSFDHNSSYAVELRDVAANPVFANLTASSNGYNRTSGTSDARYDVIRGGGGTLHGQHAWEAAGLAYEFTGTTVAADGQLTVQPGVEARFTGAIGLDVQGKITASGSAAQPILFTTLEKTPGEWVGVTVEGTPAAFNSGSTFDYVTIEYGAYPNGDGDLNLRYASATIRHSSFRHSGEYGIATDLGGWVDIADSVFSGNTLGAIYFRDAAVNQKLANLTVQNNGPSNNRNLIDLGSGIIRSNVEWSLPAPGIPYVVEGSIDVGSGGVLTIDPGVEVQFASQTHTISAIEDGQLIADGTPQQPIKFTGVTKTPGSWDGIRFSGSATKPNLRSRLRYATIEYGGYSGGNIFTEWAYPLISNCTLTNSSEYGIYGRVVSGPKVSYTTITGSADYAIYIHEAEYKPVFDHLTATGNGPGDDRNAIAFGGGTLQGDNTWTNAGLRYDSLGDISVAADGRLAVEPGVEVRFGLHRGMDVYGRLLAIGTAQQPIKFTGMETSKGSWTGIGFVGYEDAPSAGSRLDYVTVEYGGYSHANIYTFWGQVAVSHSIIRLSGYDGVYVTNGGDMVSIQSSQIVDNGTTGTDYGVYNDDPLHTVVSAPNNWWGSTSGPTFGGQCSTGGSGSRVSGGVDFLPILSSAGGDPGTLAPGLALSLALEPDRWYVPADGVMQSVIVATLRDGAGLPVTGRKVLATTSRGKIVDGGITDPRGQARILLTSTSAGDAEVIARIDQSAQPCELVRAATTRVTFTPFDLSGALTPDSGSPYTSADIEVGPQPLMRGTPATVTVRLTNPYDHPILVNAVLGIAQSGIGLTFGPIQQWQDVPLEAHAVQTLSASYTPLVAGHWCFHLDYSWRQPGAMAGAQSASASQTLAVAQSGTGSTGQNTNSKPASTNHEELKQAFGVKTRKVNLRTFGEQTTPPSDSDTPKKDINQRINDSISVTRQVGDSMRGDPPSQDYQAIVRPVKPAMPVYQAGDAGLTAAQATAVNALFAALADGIANGRAVLASDDRYAGATEAGDLTWAAQQTAAVLYYKQQTGLAYLRMADALETWLDVYPGDHIPAVADVVALQQRLSTSGYTADEIARYRALGSSDADIEWLRQTFIARDPAEMAISVRTEHAETIADYRTLGNLLANPPATFSQQPGSAGGSKTQAAGSAAGAVLAGVYDVEEAIEVGNPLASSATIDLTVRRLGMPADWAVSVSPDQLTLAPGEHQTVTVRISPASTSVQGTTPGVAVEGHANGQLLGGVEIRVAVPTYTTLGFYRYLPLIRR